MSDSPTIFTGWLGLDLDARLSTVSFFDSLNAQIVSLPGDPSDVLSAVARQFPNAAGVLLAHHFGRRFRSGLRTSPIQLGRTVSAVACAGCALGWLDGPSPHEGMALIVVPVAHGAVAGVVEVGEGVVEVLSLSSRAGPPSESDLGDLGRTVLEAAGIQSPDLIAAPQRVVETGGIQDLMSPHTITVTRPLVAEGLAVIGGILTGEVTDVLVLDRFESQVTVAIDDDEPMLLASAGSVLPMSWHQQFEILAVRSSAVVFREGDIVVAASVVDFTMPGVWTLKFEFDANSTVRVTIVDPEDVEQFTISIV